MFLTRFDMNSIPLPVAPNLGETVHSAPMGNN